MYTPFNTILIIDDDASATLAADAYTLRRAGHETLRPEFVVSYDAIEAYREDFEWDLLDRGCFSNFRDVEARLEDLRSKNTFNVTVTLVITVEAHTEDEALDLAVDAYSLNTFFDGSVYVEDTAIVEA